MQKLYDLLLSSTGEGLALRAKSFVGIAVAVALWFGVGLNADGLNELAAQLAPLLESLKQIAAGVVGVVSFVKFIDGWIRAERYKANSLGKYAKLGKRRA